MSLVVSPFEPQAPQTWSALARTRFSMAWFATFGAVPDPPVVALIDDCLRGWGERPVRAGWASGLSDDHTPFELSLSLAGAEADLRFLVEAQGAAPTLAAQREAGLALTERWVAHGADLRRFRRIQDLFLADDCGGSFALWHAFAAAPGRAPALKVYLDPQARGPGASQELVREMFERLGLGEAWWTLVRAAGRGPELDALRYVSLDLDGSERARVKAYFVHRDINADELEARFALAPTADPGQVRRLCSLVGGGQGPWGPVPPCMAYAFVSGSDRPAAATLHFPVRSAVVDDAEARARTLRWLAATGADVRRYAAALSALSHRPLEAGVGLHTYTSLCDDGRRPRATVYLAVEALRVDPPRLAPVTPAERPFSEVAQVYGEFGFGRHPLFAWLHRQEDPLPGLAVLLGNLHGSIACTFTRWLATLVGMVPDVHVRSMLASQLHDELGHGDGDRAHVWMFERMHRAFEAELGPLAPEQMRACAQMLLDGPRMFCGDPWEGVGAAAVSEFAAEQVDREIAALLRRQDRIPESALTWAFVHEQLEQEHAGEAAEIAQRVPADPAVQAAAWRGARRAVTALWAFLDEIHRVVVRS